MKPLPQPLRRAAKDALFALQRPAHDATAHVDAAELAGVAIHWPAVLEWPPTYVWVEPLLHGMRARVPVVVQDIPQSLRGAVVIEFCRGPRTYRVVLNYSDYPELIHLGTDHGCSRALALEFKMQFRHGGYGNENVVPGGFVSDVSLVDWFAWGPRRTRDRHQFAYDVYGRFGLDFASAIRTRALEQLQNQSRVQFHGGGTKVGFGEFLGEIARARVCIDLPGNGPFCFRLVNYLAVGACVISPPHAVRMPVPLIDRRHIVYTRPDMSDLVDLCEQYSNDDVAREAIMGASRDYYRRNLYWRSLADYYLRTMLDRLPA